MTMSIWKLVLILMIVLVVFGAGRLPKVMNDIGKSVRSLRDGLKGDDAPDVAQSAATPVAKAVESAADTEAHKG